MILMRTGQFGVGLSFISYLGITGFGIEMGGQSAFAQLVVLGVSLCCIASGVYLAIIQAKYDHEKELYLTGQTSEEPTRGDKEFLSYIKEHFPVTIGDITNLKFPYDDKRTKPELLLAFRHKRIMFWVHRGDIIKTGDTFTSKDNDATIFSIGDK